MKRAVAAVAACACAAATGFCSGAAVQVRGETGWQSDHAFRVRAAGTPDAGEKNPAARRSQARRAAETMARVIALEDFTAQVYSTLDGGTMGHAGVMARVRKEFGGVIASGSVEGEKYDGTGNCAIIYEVKSVSMKQSLAKLRNRISVGQ
jgi:hypothetical protein